MQQPVVVGAFPEPFRHGWDGKRRPVEVARAAELAGEAAALEASRPPSARAAEPLRARGQDGAEGAELSGTRGAERRARDVHAAGLARGCSRGGALAADPAIVRYRYAARFDETGAVVG